jgi:hypothetical protein
MYLNGKMRAVETILEVGEGGQRRVVEGMNSTMIYYKNFCKCHIESQHNNNKK